MPPRGDTWRLVCQPLRTTRPARHVTRPNTWAVMPMHLYQDLIVMGHCQDPIRLGPALGPNGNGSCDGPNAIDPAEDLMAMDPASGPNSLGFSLRPQIICVINILWFS